MELSHTPLALGEIGAGWSRWLELPSNGSVCRTAGWTWPLCFLIAGVILLNYREA